MAAIQNHVLLGGIGNLGSTWDSSAVSSISSSSRTGEVQRPITPKIVASKKLMEAATQSVTWLPKTGMSV